MSTKIAMHTLCLVAAATPTAFGIVGIIPMHAQVLRASGPLPTFEVATIRLRPPTTPPPASETSGPPRPVLALMGTPDAQYGDRIRITGPIRFFIASAYHMPIGSESRIVGGPAWLNSDSYDIQAKIDDSLFAAVQKLPPAERRHQVELMEQTLLANRFMLKAHWETRTLPVYALEVANGRSKLIPAKSDEATLMPVLFNGRDTSVTATAISMDQFIHSPLWRPITDRIIIDQTGLSEKYDFTLKWTADSSAGDPSGAASNAPFLFTALQEQLGLRLVPTKAPVEVLVIDHIERPSEN